MYAAGVSVSLRQRMMIETSGKFLSVAGICFAIASISIRTYERVFSTHANYRAPRIADKVFLRVALVVRVTTSGSPAVIASSAARLIPHCTTATRTHELSCNKR
jgi:hypothetical protein